MNKRTRVGVVGCGFFSGNHLHSWQGLREQGVDLVAVCDLDAAKARAAAETFGVPKWYDSAARMIAAEGLDLLDIVTQVRTHRELVELSVGAGLATVVQKPFGRTLDDCRQMVAAAKKAGTFLAVHENFRFQVPNRIVSDVIRSGAIGEVNWGRISFRTGYDIYAGQPYLAEEERFIILDLGVHVLDLARAFFGEAEHVSAELQRRNPKVKGEDTATMVVRHESGTVSVVECTYESRRLPDPFPVTLVDVEGTTGAIHVGADLGIEVTADREVNRRDGDAPVLAWAARPWHVVQESVFRTCEHIHRSLVDGTPADVSGADNLKTFALCEAVYEAAASGSAVKPQP